MHLSFGHVVILLQVLFGNLNPFMLTSFGHMNPTVQAVGRTFRLGMLAPFMKASFEHRSFACLHEVTRQGPFMYTPSFGHMDLWAGKPLNGQNHLHKVWFVAASPSNQHLSNPTLGIPFEGHT